MYIIVSFTVLQIRFERSNYTYMEPQGFDIHSVEDIFMVKNIDTELTYRILFLITAGDATNLRDYETSIDDFSGTLLDFSPNLQRLQVFEQSTFFFILPDGLPEEEETVEISSEPIDDPGPAYTRPQTGAVTTIFILDDDSKNTYIILLLAAFVEHYLQTSLLVGNRPPIMCLKVLELSKLFTVL